MPGYTNQYSQTVLDWAHPTTANGDHVGYSANGTSETAALARTPIGATGWAPATNADPSVKANDETITSVGATAPVVVTHFAIFSAITAGVQKTTWEELDEPRTLGVDDVIIWDPGTLVVTMT